MLDTLPLPSTGFCRCNRRAHLFHLFTFSPVHLFHLAVGFPCVSVIVYLSIQVESLQAEKSGKSMAIKAHTQSTQPPLKLFGLWHWQFAITVLCGNRKLNTKLNFRIWKMEVGFGVRRKFAIIALNVDDIEHRKLLQQPGPEKISNKIGFLSCNL